MVILCVKNTFTFIRGRLLIGVGLKAIDIYVEEMPQNMYCISSATEKKIMQVPQKIYFPWHLLILGFPL